MAGRRILRRPVSIQITRQRGRSASGGIRGGVRRIVDTASRVVPKRKALLANESFGEVNAGVTRFSRKQSNAR